MTTESNIPPINTGLQCFMTSEFPQVNVMFIVDSLCTYSTRIKDWGHLSSELLLCVGDIHLAYTYLKRSAADIKKNGKKASS